MRTMLWQSLSNPSLERFVLSSDPKGYHLAGTVVTAGALGPTEIRYSILTDPEWVTRLVGMHVQTPTGNRRLALESDGQGNWTAGGEPVTEVAGAIDPDLSFSPSTNTLPIRRLAMAEGASTEILAMYIDPTGEGVSISRQRYERTAARNYRYSSGGFKADITVDDDGLVTGYPGSFTTVARS